MAGELEDEWRPGHASGCDGKLFVDWPRWDIEFVDLSGKVAFQSGGGSMGMSRGISGP